ncbi:MAG TPA: hypothetical protein VIK91_02870 [Nannocystis sp.]
MRILILMVTTLVTTGALASTLAHHDRAAGGPRVADLEVFGDGLTFVASGSVRGIAGDVDDLEVQVKVRGVVKGECASSGAAAPQRFAVPLVMTGAATTRRASRAERTFFVRTAPPRVTSAEVCPRSEWSVAVREVVFIGARLQIGRGAGALECQFPAVDGPVDEPGCRIQP